MDPHSASDVDSEMADSEKTPSGMDTDSDIFAESDEGTLSETDIPSPLSPINAGGCGSSDTENTDTQNTKTEDDEMVADEYEWEILKEDLDRSLDEEEEQALFHQTLGSSSSDSMLTDLSSLNTSDSMSQGSCAATPKGDLPYDSVDFDNSPSCSSYMISGPLRPLNSNSQVAVNEEERNRRAHLTRLSRLRSQLDYINSTNWMFPSIDVLLGNTEIPIKKDKK